MKYKIALLFFLSTYLITCLNAGVLNLGMTGAVKSKVKELDKKVKESKVYIPEYTSLNTENLPASRILDVPTRKQLLGFCYIESFAMLMAFLDNSITIEEVVAYSGSGAILHYDSYIKSFSPTVPYPNSPIYYELSNYGAHYILGSAGGYGWSQLYNNAYAKITYTNETDAMKYLKAALNSGRPSQVYIDLGYLPTLTNVKYPGVLPGAGSHWILVTGYDTDGIYLNETYTNEGSTNQYKNFEVPVSEFLQAWQKGADVSRGESGPYWMMFIEEKTVAELTGKKSGTDILTMQKQFSANNATTIENNLNSDFSKTIWNEVARIKEAFGNYIIQVGFTEAGNLYKSLSDDYKACDTMTVDGKKTQLNNVIKQKEVEARTKY